MARLCPHGKLDRALDMLDDDLGAGLEALEDLARKYPKDPNVRSALGVAYMDDERPFEALPHLEWVERKESTPALEETLLAAYLELGMPQHAVRLAKRSGRWSRSEASDALADAQGASDPNAGLSTQDRLDFERARSALLHHAGGTADLQRLLEKHPDYVPVRNLLTTSRFLQGDVAGYVDAARDTLERAPDDPHALLNAVRAALLQGGIDAARAYRPQIDALVPDDGWGGDRYIARAEALALMDDADAADAALSAYHDWAQKTGDRSETKGVLALDDLLDGRRADPHAPLVDLDTLLAGIFANWRGKRAQRVFADAHSDLRSIAGVLRELPRWIGYQRRPVIRTLTMLLLDDDAPPAPEGTWAEVFEHVGRHGPGTRAGRTEMLRLLAETGHIDAAKGVVMDGDDESIDLRRLVLTDEGFPMGLPAEERERMIAALHDVAADRTQSALPVLQDLHERYPDSAPVAYNLALAERLMGVDGARARLERLVERQPDYLFARAELALMAMDAGELDLATSLLVMPEGVTTIHTLEWGEFAAATGRLALEYGRVDEAEEILDAMHDTLGNDQPPYLALDDAIERHYQSLVRGDAATERVLSDEHDDDGADEAWDDELDAGGDLLDDVPSLDELGGLASLDEEWSVAVRPAAFLIGEELEPTLMWLAAVADEHGLVRIALAEARALDAEAAYALFAKACTGSLASVEPGLPRRVIVADADLARALAGRIAALVVDVTSGDAAPADAALRSMAEALSGGAPPWLADAHPDHVTAFFRAAEAFYDAMPWNHFESDASLAFRVGDGPWRYATVMGHLGEEFGVTVFESIDGADAFATSPYDDDDDDDDDVGTAALRAVGGVEGLSLTPLTYLSPLDAGCYLLADQQPDVDGVVAAWLRFEADGQTLPHHGPAVYAALIDAIAEHARRTQHQVRRIDTTIDTPEGPLRLTFPAAGDEEAREPGSA